MKNVGSCGAGDVSGADDDRVSRGGVSGAGDGDNGVGRGGNVCSLITSECYRKKH